MCLFVCVPAPVSLSVCLAYECFENVVVTLGIVGVGNHALPKLHGFKLVKRSSELCDWTIKHVIELIFEIHVDTLKCSSAM